MNVRSVNGTLCGQWMKIEQGEGEENGSIGGERERRRTWGGNQELCVVILPILALNIHVLSILGR